MKFGAGKSLLAIGMLLVVLCCVTACGTNERIENAQEQALNAQDNAKTAVKDYNKQVNQLEEAAQSVE